MFFGNPFQGQGQQKQQQQQEQANTGEQAQKQEINTTQFYELLEVNKQATAQQIRKAFRKRALKAHPDKGGDPQKFKRISEAYEILSNPQKRQLYDQWGEQGVKNGGPPGQQGGMGDFFNFFGNGKGQDKGPKKMKSRLVEMQITLKQIYQGIVKKIPIKRLRVCQQCQGKGGKDAQKCKDCQGKGTQIKLVQIGGFGNMMAQAEVKCQKCQGSGMIIQEENKCKKCQTKKVIEVEATIQVAVEPGCPDFHDYVLTGEGDQYPGVMAGDIYARVKIIQPEQKEQHLFRKGADLRYVKKISLLQALTGVTFKINHLDGKEYLIATAPGQILSNKMIKSVRKLGMPFYKDSMSYGNLHVQFIVQFPGVQEMGMDQVKAQVLKEVLGKLSSNDQTKQAQALKKQKEEWEKDELKSKRCVKMGQFSEEMINKSPNYARGQEEEEEQEEGRGQAVQCGNQ